MLLHSYTGITLTVTPFQIYVVHQNTHNINKTIEILREKSTVT